MAQAPHIDCPGYEDYVRSNQAAREYASRLVDEIAI